MRKKLNLTIDRDVYDALEEFPRKISISEFVNFMLKGYVETFKRGHVLSQKEVDEIVAQMGGQEFKERLVNTFGTLDQANAFAEWIKDVVGQVKEQGEPKPMT